MVIIGYNEEPFGKNGNLIQFYSTEKKYKNTIRLFFNKELEFLPSSIKKNYHFSIINDMSRLVSAQLSKKKQKKFKCDMRLQGFGTEKILPKHEEMCSSFDSVGTSLPKYKERFLQFKNRQNTVEFPIRVYTDFESLLESISQMSGEVHKYKKHTPVTFAACIVSRVLGFQVNHSIHTNLDAPKVFVEKLEKLCHDAHKMFIEPTPIIWNAQAAKLYDSPHQCYACGGKFVKNNNKLRKVREHCHYTGKFSRRLTFCE